MHFWSTNQDCLNKDFVVKAVNIIQAGTIEGLAEIINRNNVNIRYETQKNGVESRGAMQYDAKWTTQRTLLHVAIESSNQGAVNFLQALGAEVSINMRITKQSGQRKAFQHSGISGLYSTWSERQPNAPEIQEITTQQLLDKMRGTAIMALDKR